MSDITIKNITEFRQSRNVLAVALSAFLICFIIYYFYGGLLTFALIFSVFLGIFYYSQDILLYHPDLPSNSRSYVSLPSIHQLPFEAINIKSGKVILHAFWICQSDERCKSVPTFVYFHGNAGNMGHRLQNAWGIYYQLNCNILMVEYRGYGLSTGSPSESGFQKDSRAAIDYLYTRHDLDHSKIVVFGRSLGGAVAIDLSCDAVYSQKIMCTIVENTFTSIPDMAVELVHPYLKYIPSILYKNQYFSIYKIKRSSVPFLFISGLADNLVPPRMMRALYTKCGSQRKYILEYIGGTHNETWILEGYYQGIKNFLDECQNIIGPLDKPPERNKIFQTIHVV